jgi:dynein heavy chain
MVHLSVQLFSEEYKLKYKRSNFSTPKNFLDFIKNYLGFLAQKRKTMANNVQRLDGGLATLAKAEKATQVLSA